MAKQSKNKKRPRDLNLLAKSIIDDAVDENPTMKESNQQDPAKNPHAVALGRLGGLKGGKRRKELLSKERRSEIARKAAKTRWTK